MWRRRLWRNLHKFLTVKGLSWVLGRFLLFAELTIFGVVVAIAAQESAATYWAAHPTALPTQAVLIVTATPQPTAELECTGAMCVLSLAVSSQVGLIPILVVLLGFGLVIYMISAIADKKFW